MTPKETLARYRPHDGTVTGMLASRVAAGPERCFLWFEGRSWSFEQVERASARAASVLAGCGVMRGDRVAIRAMNSDGWVIAFFALQRLGATLVPINPELGPAETQYLREHSDPKLVLSALDLVDLAGVSSSSELAPRAASEDISAILYTSGTTGFPKGALHSQSNFVTAGEAFVERMYLCPEDRLLCVLPLFHVNALFYSLGGALAAGATLVLATRFSASNFWRIAVESGATEVNIIAAIGAILCKRSRAEFHPDHKIRKLYGAPVPPEVAAIFRSELGVPTVIEGYGMTEIPGAANNPFLGPHKPGSIGLPALHPDHARRFAELRLVADGADVLDGELGEIWVKTPIVMKGYFRDPVQTAAAFSEGWFKTGDIARRDADGFYYFVARAKDIIRRRGENISGAELDRVLAACPVVLEAAAIAVPSELGEDEILAAVILRPGCSPDAPAIADWCRRHLAEHKTPRYVVFVDQLPHTPTHRVAKEELKKDRTLLARAVDLTPPPRGEP